MKDIQEEIWLEFHKFYEAGRRGDSYDGLPQTNKIIDRVLDAAVEAVGANYHIMQAGKPETTGVKLHNSVVTLNIEAINKLRGEK